MTTWTEIPCPDCGGHGWRRVHRPDGSEFHSADACLVCDGGGCIFRSAVGVLAQWPNGPLIGSEPNGVNC
jgi:hypothetical protein